MSLPTETTKGGESMAFDVKRVEFYETTVQGHAAEASRLLFLIAGLGVNLLAYKAVPLEPMRTRFSLVLNDGSGMTAGAKKAGLKLDGPHHGLLIQGDDESGALAHIYERLSRTDIDVRDSSGIANIEGRYGVVLYLKQEDCDRAIAAFQV
jgi:hypothetical protein